ncbi:ATP-binding cassette domain-containing protein [Streptomyces sp. NBC_01190]|uniref:ATP-binding cassette domain-containing protein n=1 Tax=Streptomyces sp. NBC_01190 TaxID=2903767 RepID=UPI00386913C4|nr:ABC transporter ATP-binding protein/permease [Streptomyces sp. NBC_01190]
MPGPFLTPAPPRRSGRRLLAGALRGSGPAAARIAGWSVLEAMPALMCGWVTAAALDRGFLKGDTARGLAWLALLGALYVVRALATRAMFGDLARVVEPMRDALVTGVVRGALSRAVAAGRPIGTADVARLGGQVDAVRGVVAALLRQARPLAVTLLATVVGLAALSPVLAAMALAPLSVALAAFGLSMRALTARRRVQVLAEEEVAVLGGAVVGGLRDITALGAQARMAAGMRRTVEASAAATLSVARATAWRVPLVLVGGYLPLLGLLWAGPDLVEHGRVSTGALVGAATYVTANLVPALEMVTGMFSGYWTQLRIMLDRLAESVARDEGRGPRRPASDTPAADGAAAVRTGRGAPKDGIRDRRAQPGQDRARPAAGVAGDVRLPALVAARLTFAYGPRAAPVLDGMELTVPYGDHLAVVGPSGVGKSTLAGLLAGVETPCGGSVTVGGRPVAALGDRARCALITLVPQDPYVLAGTLAENVRYLAPEAGTDVLARAADAVGLTPVVRRLGGWDARLPDPMGQLSDGERQLIVLARAYVSPAPVVILDEATCHLDMAAEARAERAFAERPGTVIVIAHRLSSAVRASRVLLLDGDHPVLGTHVELLTASPAYADLFGHWSDPAPDTRTTAAG